MSSGLDEQKKRRALWRWRLLVWSHVPSLWVFSYLIMEAAASAFRSPECPGRLFQALFALVCPFAYQTLPERFTLQQRMTVRLFSAGHSLSFRVIGSWIWWPLKSAITSVGSVLWLAIMAIPVISIDYESCHPILSIPQWQGLDRGLLGLMLVSALFIYVPAKELLIKPIDKANLDFVRTSAVAIDTERARIGDTVVHRVPNAEGPGERVFWARAKHWRTGMLTFVGGATGKEFLEALLRVRYGLVATIEGGDSLEHSFEPAQLNLPIAAHER